jgi:hypothetical protein
MAESDQPLQREIVVSKEDAVFWMDGNGVWRNAHGPFENKKIIDYFHARIGKDEGGFFVSQSHGDLWEKVYFPYEDTALFVFEVARADDALMLRLNTGSKIRLHPENLRIKGDHLYLRKDGEWIKFTEQSLFQISPYLDFPKNRCLFSMGSQTVEIPEA